ncbi:putative translation initiation factor 3 [Medicago truncatula]|uniref:Translation initiation factor IF-3 n=2 Tax=Medicago truncatula TaxID=3880 RepID=G7JFJ8_MEDTR|nr:translation initiation factor IF3-4, chloroplastic isoform X1 [Medicago truncatula]AES92481.1 translation initiation factor IF-3 [Medicago truncatula]RHN64866.1 putative translation initiation factor 3 [Medicago truncatula]
MAGITSTTVVPVKLKASHFFSNKLSIPHSLNLQSSPSFTLPSHATVRYGVNLRPSAYGGGGNFRRAPPEKDADDGQALDLSTLSSNTVRLIDQSQNMVGVVSLDQAIRMAEDAELDLVIVSAEADPPVVRIMNYSKYRYELQKKKRDQQKKSAASRMDLKELKMGYNIDQHDYSVRLKAARKFLSDGDKVKVIVNLKGREKEFRNNAIELIRRFQNDVGKLATEEAKNFRDKNIFITLIPNKTEVQKPQETPTKAATDEVSVSVEA